MRERPISCRTDTLLLACRKRRSPSSVAPSNGAPPATTATTVPLLPLLLLSRPFQIRIGRETESAVAFNCRGQLMGIISISSSSGQMLSFPKIELLVHLLVCSRIDGRRRLTAAVVAILCSSTTSQCDCFPPVLPLAILRPMPPSVVEVHVVVHLISVRRWQTAAASAAFPRHSEEHMEQAIGERANARSLTV